MLRLLLDRFAHINRNTLRYSLLGTVLAIIFLPAYVAAAQDPTNFSVPKKAPPSKPPKHKAPHSKKHVAHKKHTQRVARAVAGPSQAERFAELKTRAAALLDRGDFEGAEKACRTALAIKSEDEAIQNILRDVQKEEHLRNANTALGKHDLDTAKREAQAVIDLVGDHAEAVDILNRVTQQHRLDDIRKAFAVVDTDPDAAQKIGDALIAADPNDEDANDIFERVKVSRHNKELEDARKLLDSDPATAEQKADEILTLHPNDDAAKEIKAKARENLFAKFVAKAETDMSSDPESAAATIAKALKINPDDASALSLSQKIDALRYEPAIKEARDNAISNPGLAEKAAKLALQLRPGDKEASEILEKVQARLNRETSKQDAINQAAADAASGLTVKALEEYRALTAKYPADTDLGIAAATAMFNSGAILDAADALMATELAAATDPDRAHCEALLQSWRDKVLPLNSARLNSAISEMKAGQFEQAVDKVVASSRLMEDRHVGAATEWLAQFAAGHDEKAVEAFRDWIKTPNRQPEDVGLSPLTAALPEVVRPAAKSQRYATLIADAFGPDGADQIEASINSAAASHRVPDSNPGSKSRPKVAVPTAAPTTRIDPASGAEMLWIPFGSTVLGSDSAEFARWPGAFEVEPRHTVETLGFWISKTPVTVAQFKAYCAATGVDFLTFHAPDWGWRDNDPMVNVSWIQASDFCRWVGGSLPSEAQWEMAARGTEGLEFPWGNHWDPRRLHWNTHSTKSVGSYPQGKSPFGCLDMAGNVWQWCTDQNVRHEYVLHGGAWNTIVPANARSATRLYALPISQQPYIGFRFVCLK